MKMACCEGCGSLDREKSLHLARMDEYHEHFAKEHRHAMAEYKRLEELLRNVVWYNFETIAREWRNPWPESYRDTTLLLHGMRYDIVAGRGGRLAEKGSFPVYYHGTVRDAPSLPPEIVLCELERAHQLVLQTGTACDAPYDWAPGGRLYEKMMRESPGVAAFSSKHTDKTNGLFLGDRLEREISTSTETTADDILGRVCGDRSLVRA